MSEGKNYNCKQAHAFSKLANILFTYELVRRLKSAGIYANAFNPGGVTTNFARNNGLFPWFKHLLAHTPANDLICPQLGAETSIFVVTSPDLENVSGQYFHRKESVRSSAVSYYEESARSLWEFSMGAVGLRESTI